MTTDGQKWEEFTLHPQFLLASWEMCMQVQKQLLEPDLEQQSGSKLQKEYERLYIVTLLI